MATNTTEVLPGFITTVADKILSSSDVIYGEGIVDPLIINSMSNYLKKDYSDNDIENFIKDLDNNSLLKKVDIKTDFEFWKSCFSTIMRPFEKWTDTIPKKKSQQTELYYNMSQNFIRYMKEFTGISWISANYYAKFIQEFLFNYQDKHH